MITTENNNVIFQFIEQNTSTRFINSTAAGLLVTETDGQQASIPRWGVVIAVGSAVKDIVTDDYILVDAGKWTPGFYVDGKRYWKTDDSMISLVSDEPGTTY